MLHHDFENDVQETVWIGDDAVDTSASDIRRWVTTGEGIVLIQGARPSTIKYRGITPRQYANIVTDSAGYMGNLIAEIARYGIVGIAGISIPWERRGGLRCLDDGTLDMLAALEAPVPITVAQRHLVSSIYHLVSQYGVDVDEPAIESGDETEEGTVSALAWIAGLIAARSFRS